MASRRSRPRRLLIPTILAAILAAEITGLALARTLVPAAPPAHVAVASASSAPSATGRGQDASQADARDLARAATSTPLDAGANAAVLTTSPTGRPAEKVRPAVATVKPKTSSTSGSGHGTSHAASASYHGRNHVWIPSLGIS